MVLSKRKAKLWLWCGFALIGALACTGDDSTGNEDPDPDPPPPGSEVITLEPNTKYQTMVGWEATAEAGQVECPATAFQRYKDEIFDRAVTELGINRVRLQVASGSENPHDYFADLQAGRITAQIWRQHWYEIVNDNADPNNRNAAGFQFSYLDHTIETVVLPLKQRLEARGERLYVNLNYVDLGNSPFEHKTAPAEYAEFMLAVFQHMDARYHWVPDGVEVVLEPDNQGAWTAAQIGQAVLAAGARLKAAGYRPDFIAPSNTNPGGALTFFDQIIALPGIKEYLKEFSYHRYGSVSEPTLTAIGARRSQHGIRTSMLERITAGYEQLLQDLKLSGVSAWAQFTLAYCSGDNGAHYYNVDVQNPSAPRVTIGSRTKFLRQYFLFVRSGAVRIQAVSSDANFDPMAFINQNGKTVLVVKAAAAGNFSVRLPAGQYGRKYTTSSEYDVDQPDVTLSAGQTLNASIPAAGVITIYAR